MNETKEHILKIALVLFLKKSFKEVTMKEIVQKTGLSKGAFYHYFSSKEKLFQEVISSLYFEMIEVDFSKFNQDTFYGFYNDYVKDGIKSFMDLKELINDTNDDDDINYFLLAFDAINIFPGFNERIKNYHVKELFEWAEAVARAKANGEIKTSMTNEQVAKMFVYSNDGIGLHLIQEGRVKQLGKEMLELWDGFYNELKA